MSTFRRVKTYTWFHYEANSSKSLMTKSYDPYDDQETNCREFGLFLLEACGTQKSRRRRGREDGVSSSKKSSPSSLSVTMPEVGILSQMEEEIEKQLDEKAFKSNLSVVNVKNILKHVLTNERVLAMVRHTMHEGDNLNDDESLEDVPVPKLTRSKTKELLQKQPEIAWSMTPTKRPVVSECQALIDQDLPEDSSDEEYQPNEEDLMSISDFDHESQPNTPFSASTPRPPSNLDCSTQTSVSWIEDGTFQTPLENIGQRTRSKLSLSDTALETIEKTLVPPDITTDMYELECDDDDWKDFLKQFAEPLRTNLNDTIDDDDEADPEYNLLADEDAEDVDQEELRMDRGVKVSKKEVNQLMKELMDMFEDYDDYEPAIRTDPRKQLHEVEHVNCDVTKETLVEDATTSDATVEAPLCDIQLSIEQQLLLGLQMRKHVQLTAQHFVQTYGHPELSSMAQQCKEQLVFLKNSAGENSQSSFMAANLDAALELIKEWADLMDGTSSYKIKQFINNQITIAKAYRKTRRKYVSEFPFQLLDLVSKSKAIVYPLLLPPLPFRCDGFFHTYFLPSEDHLIAIGLEQFMPYVKEKKSLFQKQFNVPDALLLVAKHLLPCHDLQVLINHVHKERKSKKNKLNPIKYYFEHKKAPGTEHFVVAFDNKSLRPLRLQPPELLPTMWKEHNFPGHSSDSLEFPISFHSTPKVISTPRSNVSVVYVPVPATAIYPY